VDVIFELKIFLEIWKIFQNENCFTKFECH